MNSHDQTTLPTLRLQGDAPGSSSRSRGRGRLLPGCVGLLCLLLGAVLGGAGVLFYVSMNAGDRHIVVNIPPQTDAAISVQLSSSYLTQVLQKQVKQLPGVSSDIKNVQVTVGQDGAMIVTGDGQINLILGLTVTKHITLRLQPYVKNCQMQMHVLSIDLGGIPILLSLDAFYTGLENQINAQLHISSSELPQGFTYCMTGVRASPPGLIVTYSATPTS